MQALDNLHEKNCDILVGGEVGYVVKCLAFLKGIDQTCDIMNPWG